MNTLLSAIFKFCTTKNLKINKRAKKLKKFADR